VCPIIKYGNVAEEVPCTGHEVVSAVQHNAMKTYRDPDVEAPFTGLRHWGPVSHLGIFRPKNEPTFPLSVWATVKVFTRWARKYFAQLRVPNPSVQSVASDFSKVSGHLLVKWKVT
jgi:hypothetical protein